MKGSDRPRVVQDQSLRSVVFTLGEMQTDDHVWIDWLRRHGVMRHATRVDTTKLRPFRALADELDHFVCDEDNSKWLHEGDGPFDVLDVPKLCGDVRLSRSDLEQHQSSLPPFRKPRRRAVAYDISVQCKGLRCSFLHDFVNDLPIVRALRRKYQEVRPTYNLVVVDCGVSVARPGMEAEHPFRTWAWDADRHEDALRKTPPILEGVVALEDDATLTVHDEGVPHVLTSGCRTFFPRDPEGDFDGLWPPEGLTMALRCGETLVWNAALFRRRSQFDARAASRARRQIWFRLHWCNALELGSSFDEFYAFWRRQRSAIKGKWAFALDAQGTWTAQRLQKKMSDFYSCPAGVLVSPVVLFTQQPRDRTPTPPPPPAAADPRRAKKGRKPNKKASSSSRSKKGKKPNKRARVHPEWTPVSGCACAGKALAVRPSPSYPEDDGSSSWRPSEDGDGGDDEEGVGEEEEEEEATVRESSSQTKPKGRRGRRRVSLTAEDLEVELEEVKDAAADKEGAAPQSSPRQRPTRNVVTARHPWESTTAPGLGREGVVFQRCQVVVRMRLRETGETTTTTKYINRGKNRGVCSAQDGICGAKAAFHKGMQTLAEGCEKTFLRHAALYDLTSPVVVCDAVAWRGRGVRVA